MRVTTTQLMSLPVPCLSSIAASVLRLPPICLVNVSPSGRLVRDRLVFVSAFWEWQNAAG